MATVKDHPLYAAKASARTGHRHVVNRIHHDEASLGERLADRIAAGIGSWNFLIIQSGVVAAWITLNVLGVWIWKWDPYPFILLNLAFSTQAAYTGPVLLLAGNRQSQKDRLTLEHAANEADELEKRTLTILKEIERNTEITVKILENLQTQQSYILESNQRMVEVHEQLARTAKPAS
jgi:uncharacterized membrane protein